MDEWAIKSHHVRGLEGWLSACCSCRAESSRPNTCVWQRASMYEYSCMGWDVLFPPLQALHTREWTLRHTHTHVSKVKNFFILFFGRIAFNHALWYLGRSKPEADSGMSLALRAVGRGQWHLQALQIVFARWLYRHELTNPWQSFKQAETGRASPTLLVLVHLEMCTLN